MEDAFPILLKNMDIWLAKDYASAVCWNKENNIMVILYPQWQGDNVQIRARRVKDQNTLDIWKRKIGVLLPEEVEALEGRLKTKSERRELLRLLMDEFSDEFVDLVKEEARQRKLRAIIGRRNEKKNVEGLISALVESVMFEATQEKPLVKDPPLPGDEIPELEEEGEAE